MHACRPHARQASEVERPTDRDAARSSMHSIVTPPKAAALEERERGERQGNARGGGRQLWVCPMPMQQRPVAHYVLLSYSLGSMSPAQ